MEETPSGNVLAEASSASPAVMALDGLASLKGTNELKRTIADDAVTARDLKQALAGVKEDAFDGVRSLQLSASTTQDILSVITRAFESGEHRCVQQHIPSEETSPMLTLRFNHDCLALGCNQTICDLCESNPRRRCIGDFDKKYFKGDVIRAKCGGAIYVEVVTVETGEPVTADQLAPGAMIELAVIDGNKYEQLFPHGGPTAQTMHSLERCMLLVGNEGRPLLQADDKASNRDNGKVHIPFQNPKTIISELRVLCSSEALLSGRRPPFRLMARYTSPTQRQEQCVLPGISNNFIVASGRSRQCQKKSIPFADDPVSRLENMGKERVKKLGNLKLTAQEMNVDFPDRDHYKIATVSDFRKVAFDADTDGQLKQKLLHMLKMSEKQWEEARDHAACCITNDTRMRAWYRPGITDMQGLAYVCYMGETDIHRPVALLIATSIVLKENLDVSQRNLMKELQALAVEAWWQPNHPGWTFFSFDSETYKKNHVSLTSIGQAPSDHHGRKWTVPVEADPEPHKLQMSRARAPPPLARDSKRMKKNRPCKTNVPQSPPSPRLVRSPYETRYVVNSEEALGAPLAQQQNLFETKEGTATALPSFSGPVIPRAPPDSAFTRRIGARGHNKGAVMADAATTGHHQLPNSSVLEQFYVTTSASSSKAVSNSGTSDVYAPLTTPFDTRKMDALIKENYAQHQFKTDSGEDRVTDGNAEDPAPISRQGMGVYVNTAAQEERLPVSQALNRFSCSIESLSPPCKDAIFEEQCIRQIENGNGYSNQDFQCSDGCMRGQMKRHVGKSPGAHTEGALIPLELPMSQSQLPESLQQLSATNPGVFSYNAIVFVPFASGEQPQQRQDSAGHHHYQQQQNKA